MLKKTVKSFVWRVIFTISYTAVILPFTVNFFQHIATPSIKETLMQMIPLVDAHNFMLPIFLACLEFASIGLACSLWEKKQDINRMFILMLFLGCQFFPMVSLYYDVRGRDYQTEKNEFENQKKEIADALSNRIKSLDKQISVMSKNIVELRKERHEGNSSINQLLIIGQESPHEVVADMKSEIRERRKFRERDEEKASDLFNTKKFLEADLKKLEDELQATASQTMKYGTQLEYIVRELFSYKSAFAGFIAFLFPLTILAVAFVLPKNSKADIGELSSFNLQDHLRNAASLPQDMHYNYSRLLVPSIDAYISSFRASKTILNENDALNLHDILIRQIISEVKVLQEQVASSKLEENSKSYLLNELSNILNKQLTGKEAISHV